jgi:hypothetical protein
LIDCSFTQEVSLTNLTLAANTASTLDFLFDRALIVEIMDGVQQIQQQQGVSHADRIANDLIAILVKEDSRTALEQVRTQIRQHLQNH